MKSATIMMSLINRNVASLMLTSSVDLRWAQPKHWIEAFSAFIIIIISGGDFFFFFSLFCFVEDSHLLLFVLYSSITPYLITSRLALSIWGLLNNCLVRLQLISFLSQCEPSSSLSFCKLRTETIVSLFLGECFSEAVILLLSLILPNALVHFPQISIGVWNLVRMRCSLITTQENI